MHWIKCIFCKSEMKVSVEAAAGLCDRCVARLADPPKQPVAAPVLAPGEKKARKEAREAKKAAKLQAAKTATKGKGQGWHFKPLFEWEGKFYSYGKEIDDAEVARIRKILKSGGKVK